MLEQRLRRIGFDTDGLRRINWSKWVLIVMTLVIALTIGSVGIRSAFRGRIWLEISILGIVFFVMLGLILYRLELGVVAIMFTSLFVRFTIPTGTSSNIPASLIVSAIVVLIWVLSMLVRRHVQLAPGRYVLPSIVFIVLAILSVPYSWLLLRPDLFGLGIWAKTELSFTFAQIGGVTLMVLLPAVMLMTANILRQEKWFKVLFALMILVAVPEVLQRAMDTRFAIGDFRLQTGASYPLWIVALTIGQAYFNQSLRYWQRGLLVGIAALWFLFNAERNTVWLSGWMPAVVALMFLTFFRSRKLFIVFLLIGLFVVAARADYYLGYVLDDAIKSDSNRFEIWRIIIFDLTLTKTNIIFGAGPAGYLPFYQLYYPGQAWSSHNNYIDIIAEMGIVGISVFLWLLYGVFRTGWEQRKEMPSGFLRGFNFGVLGGFVGTLFAMGLGDWYIPFVYNVGIPGFDFAVHGWLLTGAMLALSYMKQSQTASAHVKS
jgi:hypothetical protein